LVKKTKLYLVHGTKSIYPGEHDALVVTHCGKRVSLSVNRQRVSRNLRDVGCKRCRASMLAVVAKPGERRTPAWWTEED
jgi:hypothetical protein